MEQILSKAIEYEKYVVLKKTSQDLPKGHWTYIAMIDRHKSKAHWWTVSENMAMKYNLKSAAEDKAKSLKYGPCIAIKLADFDKYVGREFWKQTKADHSLAITAELEAKENQFDFEDASSEASAQEVYSQHSHTSNKKHKKSHKHHRNSELADAVHFKEAFGSPTEDYDDYTGYDFRSFEEQMEEMDRTGDYDFYNEKF